MIVTFLHHLRLAIGRRNRPKTYRLENIGLQREIQGCIKGDRLCQHAIYTRFAKTMYNSSYRIVQHTADAEDLLQDAFIDAFKNIGTYNESNSFEGWLRRIIINKSISFVRKKKYIWSDISNENIADDGYENDDSELDFEQNIYQIKEAVKKLPVQYRLVFTLYAVDDLSHQEISNMLQLSTSNVRVIYMRAKRKILETIKKEAVI